VTAPLGDAGLVVVGRVVKAHGIRGEVVVDLLSDVPGRLDAGVTVQLGGRPATILASRPHQGRLLVTFDGVPDRTAAERLRGRVLEAERIDLDDTDAYFVHELVGLPVRAADGQELGTVQAAVELPETAGYDLLEVVRADGATWLLPAVDEYVEVVDDPGGRQALVVVDPPSGLLEEALADTAPAASAAPQGDEATAASATPPGDEAPTDRDASR
jgi:16S rRNA processing protein RimM